ncbi:hypothetical protein PHLCEN_2v9400 [Hermanssonia centrifuga]|uniref:Uncharacterized protein n=1 Tax=Hermanssonia centrifuga TaxID=98765 RepID=A0A2R6NQT6_9APHY|nr:hypothetical protein PHLCEN_2v9400 [Hermanssonia centrifuga]
MSSIRKLVAYALGHNTDVQSIAAQLEEACVPVSTDDCRGCADPCDEGHEEYPRFDVDMETQLLGSMKPYRRQVVISTGKSDWAHEVTSTSGTLAAFLDSIAPSGPKGPKGPKPASPDSAPPSEPKKGINGIYDPSQTKRIAILNGSHHTVCEDSTHETVLVLPDYKVVTEVERSKEGAQLLWREAVDPALGRTGAVVEGSPVRSWVLPYSCVILLCKFHVLVNIFE